MKARPAAAWRDAPPGAEGWRVVEDFETVALSEEDGHTQRLPSPGDGAVRQVVLDRYRLERGPGGGGLGWGGVRRWCRCGWGGAGGFGVVWLAFDEKLEREVAVKVIPREGDAEPVPQRAEREARVAARLNHPGIVSLYELGADDEAVYLVSELVPGRNLAEL